MFTLTRKLAASAILGTLAAVAVSLACHASGCDDETAATCIGLAQLAGTAAGLI